MIEYYTPIDNSWMQCIDDNGENHMLAGYHSNPERIKLKVLIQPFKMAQYWKVTDKEYINTYIIGLDESTNLRHLVLYYGDYEE